ncbi:metal ABC transporter substrate-binding protein [Candidimonas sp. SYP-B2681]|uniref:metal ABC transporter substrate-binding protein n=1 Tax=Candidimonas sp. SYP-B2681 TaxID=2497686 RepID=UPI000F875941|nr:metal ABC transporter substrate-binding protein [Candidimonas sp. SYP-B2681]RTZ45683.1 metal ABC transporter substrate-binding protein [Candidimonas sp. SYP-B2681]
MSKVRNAAMAVKLSRRSVLALLSGAFLAVLSPTVSAAEEPPLRVVASFSIIGDMVKEIGGEHVSLTTIVGPNGDAHSFEPTPRDVKALSQAQVLVINGLDFEGWLPRLINAAGFKGAQVLASDGVVLRSLGDGKTKDEIAVGSAGKPDTTSAKHDHVHDKHGHGDIDPHAWQSLSNGMKYAKNIADGLSLADPRRSGYYQSRAEIYIGRMEKLDAEIKQAFESIPQDRRKVLTSHDAFGYFAEAYGIRFISVVGLSSQAEPSASEVANIIDRARKEKVSGVFMENTTNSRLVTQIARETGSKVGGSLYSDALAPPDQPASTYLGMFSWNAGQLIYVLTPAD